LKPFTLEAWMSILAIYVFASLSIWVLARCSPGERKRTDSDGEPLFSLANVFWITGSAMLFRGSNIQPKVKRYGVSTV
jgi:hypothetical protein